MKVNNDWDLSSDEQKEALNGGKELTQEFLFNEKNFNTLLIQTNHSQASNSAPVLDVQKFIEQYSNPSDKNDLLLWLKQNNYRTLLLDQIKQCKEAIILSKLIAAYWEAGFNEPTDLLVFIPFLLSSDMSVVLEAYSAIMGLSKPFLEKDVRQAIEWIEQALPLSKDTSVWVEEVLEMLKSELSANY